MIKGGSYNIAVIGDQTNATHMWTAMFRGEPSVDRKQGVVDWLELIAQGCSAANVRRTP